MKEINKDMLIGDVLDEEPGLAVFFLQMGMHCLGCPASRGESVEEACMVHGIDSTVLIDEINEYLSSRESNK